MKSDELTIAMHFRDWKEKFPKKWLDQTMQKIGKKATFIEYDERALGSDDKIVVVVPSKFTDEVHKLVQKHQTDLVELLGDEQVHSFDSVKALDSEVTQAVRDFERSERLDEKERKEYEILAKLKKTSVDDEQLMKKHGISNFNHIDKLKKLHNLDSKRSFSMYSLAIHLELKELRKFKEELKNSALKHKKPIENNQTIESDVDLS